MQQRSLRRSPLAAGVQLCRQETRENSSRPAVRGRQVTVRALNQFEPRTLQVKLAKGLTLPVTHPPSFLVAAEPSTPGSKRREEKEVDKQRSS